MSEQPTQVNPEYLYHHEQLRRARAWQRRRGYLFLIAAGGMLALTVLLGSTAPLELQGALIPFLLFIGFFMILLYMGLLVLKHGQRPIRDEEVARRRQEDRRQLFQFAQGTHLWRYWLSVALQGLVGLGFLFLGGGSTWIALQNLNNPHLAQIALGIPLLFAGGYYLFKAISSARLIGRLKELSSRELADRLSLGERTQGE